MVRTAIDFLHELYRAALGAADPIRVLPPHLPAPPAGRTVVVGIGKAAAAMARAVESHWPGPLSGIVVVPDGATLPLERIEQIESSHPIPDQRSVQAGRRLMEVASGLGPDDLVLALISGGGSALCALPAQGVSLEEKQAITRALLVRGATIQEINTVRKHLSAIKGGRLAAHAHPARVVSLLISDIPGDDPTLIASAPTLADATSCTDALDVLERYAVEIRTELRAALRNGSLESPKPSDGRLAGQIHKVITCAQVGLDAAARLARQRGWSVHVLSDAMQGEARDLALAHAAIAQQVQRRGQPFAAPCVILSGGEATVTVRGDGRGGRNTEFALALALALDGQAGIYALSAGTDGLDGNGPAAGSWIAPDTLARARSLALDAKKSLAQNDSFGFFEALGSTVVTGPTFTNINDFRAMLIEPPQAEQPPRMDIEHDLEHVARQERDLCFARFDLTTAWDLGTRIKTVCEQRGVAVAIEVRLVRETVFYCAMPGTTPENADWVRRKRNTVELLQRSSYLVGRSLANEGISLEQKMGLPSRDYATHGGSVPIRAEGTGCIGAVTVSGLPQREDHLLVCDVLAEMCRDSYALD